MKHKHLKKIALLSACCLAVTAVNLPFVEPKTSKASVSAERIFFDDFDAQSLDLRRWTRDDSVCLQKQYDVLRLNLADEWGRGLLQFGGTAVFATAASICSYGYHFDGAAVICIAGSLATWVWSIVDAVKVSKIKNMYIHDYLKMYGADLKVYPSVSCYAKPDGTIPVAGLTFALNF